MCGIIGYIGKREAVPILIEGLRNLEYRGYDSAGLCIKNGEEVGTVKKKGKVSELANSQSLEKLKGTSGIAHTRWATHGEPNEINAHPHFDCKRQISLVHNGIIENYIGLKEILEKEGHNFVSQTDSEVLVHLIEQFYRGNLGEATAEALKLIEGTFGILVVCKGEDKIIAAKKGSPILIGLGEEENFIASDIAPLAKHTDKIIYLKDNEIAEITCRGCSIKNLQGTNIENDVKIVRIKLDQTEKGDYKHFMLKEIFEQPEAIRNALRGRLKEGLIKLTLNIDISNLRRVVIVGCGTSWHSGLIGKYLLERLVGIPVEVNYSSEFRYSNPLVGKSDLVIVISQSGETADTLAALKEAKSKGAQTIGIINVVGSSIAREVDSGIYLHAGPEIGVASTKAFTSQIVSLLLLALYLRQRVKNGAPLEIAKELETLPEKIEKVLAKNEEIREISRKFEDSKNALYLGRGINFPVALEGALKLKEISYVHAEGYPAAEMKHGPIALVDENLPVIFVAPWDKNYEKIISNMQEIKARKGKIIALVNEGDRFAGQIADEVIEIPKSSEEISPVLNTIALQLFAYHLGDLKGLDVDKPKNLAKSVTVE